MATTLTPTSCMHPLSLFRRNYTEKEQFFRNQKESALTQARREEAAADKWLNNASAKLFQSVLLTDVMERRDNGLIASSTTDEYLKTWVNKVAYDKAAASMVKAPIDNDALTYVQKQIKAVEDPKGASFTRNGKNLRKDKRSKTRAENTGLVGAKDFHGMYPPHHPSVDDFEDHSPNNNVVFSDSNTDRSTPSLMSEATEPIQEPAVLVEVRDEACYQSGMETDRAEALDEVVQLLTGPQYDTQLMNVNKVMAERNHSIQERLDSLVRIVERRMKQRSNTI